MTDRYSHESSHTSHPRSTSDVWPCQKPDLHGHLHTRISYPTATILLSLANVKACFRYPRILSDLNGAIGFIADELYNLATAMVFGSTASVSSWEAFRQAIEAHTNVFANRPNLVVRHKKFINILKWEEIDPSAELTPTFSCTINCGIIDDARNRIDLPARIYVRINAGP